MGQDGLLHRRTRKCLLFFRAKGLNLWAKYVYCFKWYIKVYRKCMAEDIIYIIQVQLLTPKMQERRLKHSQKLLNKLKHPLQAANMLWFFLTKKTFARIKYTMTINNRWLVAQNPTEVPKFPATVMVFGVVSTVRGMSSSPRASR